MGNIFSNPGLAVRQLPGVTASDSGKTLVVNENGEWVVGDYGGGSGAGGVFVVTVTVSESHTTYTADASYNDVLAAVMAGKSVVFELTDTTEEPEYGTIVQHKVYFITEMGSNVPTDDESLDPEYYITTGYFYFDVTDPNMPLIYSDMLD